jgi:hypothetical protein
METPEVPTVAERRILGTHRISEVDSGQICSMPAERR